MHEKFLGVPSIPEIRAMPNQGNACDWIQLFDWPGFVKHLRICGRDHTAQQLEDGDELSANAIEASMSAIEANMLLTTGRTIRDDVAGACPNVPAYIMGSPYNMRNRRLDKTGRGPLALFIEMTGSGGLDKDSMIERGAALYAMVRALSIARPLELWITTTFGGVEGVMTQSAVRVETSPLDLSRAACILTRYYEICTAGAAMSRRMLDEKPPADMRAGNYAGGGWAYGVPSLERKYAGEILGRMISPGSQIAYMPAGLLGTDDFGDSNEWIKAMLRKYSPYLLSGEDREDMEEGLSATA